MQMLLLLQIHITVGNGHLYTDHTGDVQKRDFEIGKERENKNVSPLKTSNCGGCFLTFRKRLTEEILRENFKMPALDRSQILQTGNKAQLHFWDINIA